MARARNIKPGFFTNDVLAQCETGARLVFIGLWTLADREGRLEDRSMRIKAQIMPYDRCDIEKYLSQLCEFGFISRYEVGGCKFIQVNNFVKHQSPHVKEPASTIPAPGSSGANSPDCGFRIPDSGLLIPESISSSPQADDSQFDNFWNCYPKGRKVGKGKARDAWKKAIKKTSPEVIISAAVEYASSETGQGEFVKMPATWLNGECWEDDREAWQANGKPFVDPTPTKADAHAAGYKGTDE